VSVLSGSGLVFATRINFPHRHCGDSEIPGTVNSSSTDISALSGSGYPPTLLQRTSSTFVPDLALLDALVAHQFGRDESYNGHLCDIGDQSKMTHVGSGVCTAPD
jgi:hypothetical protein